MTDRRCGRSTSGSAASMRGAVRVCGTASVRDAAKHDESRMREDVQRRNVAIFRALPWCGAAFVWRDGARWRQKECASRRQRVRRRETLL